MAKLTPIKKANGGRVECSYCAADAYEEYCGLCAGCWVRLGDYQRQALRGANKPLKEIIRTETKIIIQPKEKEIVTHRTITTRIPPAWHSVALTLWRCVITTVVGYLMAKAKGWL